MAIKKRCALYFVPNKREKPFLGGRKWGNGYTDVRRRVWNGCGSVEKIASVFPLIPQHGEATDDGLRSGGVWVEKKCVTLRQVI